MAKIHLDLEDIETREFEILDDLVFFDRYDLEAYINSCDAELLTHRFFPDALTLLLQRDLDIDELRQQYGDEFEDIQARYDEEVDMLMDQFDIRFLSTYRLLGTYENLKNFCSRYCADLEWTTRGEALQDEFDKKALIDLESGDQSLILFCLSERD